MDSAVPDRVSKVRDALCSVYDPELGLDIVSMGLVYDIRDEGDAIVVEMTLTTPGCPVSESLPEEARAAAQSAVDDTAVDLRVVWDPPWTPERLTTDAGTALRRPKRRERVR